MLERELHVSFDLTLRSSLDQPSHFEGFQGVIEVRKAADDAEHTPPKRLSDYRGGQKSRSCLSWERVDAGRQDCVDRGRQFIGNSVVLNGRGELLEEQRVALRRLHDTREYSFICRGK
ncbi:MAG TPA: hypothetical protein VK773_14575, partial [Acidimicrobiales bacterium]|nr:hypothetical protein [Acidimicrobiales bacterium]